MFVKLILLVILFTCHRVSCIKNDEFYDENYKCANPDDPRRPVLASKARILLISPQDTFLFSGLLREAVGKWNPGTEMKKSLPRLTTLSGFLDLKKNSSCITVIETPQIFDIQDLIQNVKEIQERCFQSVLIGIQQESLSQPFLSNDQFELLYSQLQLLQSIYGDVIWSNMAFALVTPPESSEDARMRKFKKWVEPLVQRLDINKVFVVSKRNSTQFFKLGEFILGSNQVGRSEVEEGESVSCTRCLRQRPSHFFSKEQPIPWLGHNRYFGVNKKKPTKLNCYFYANSKYATEITFLQDQSPLSPTHVSYNEDFATATLIVEEVILATYKCKINQTVSENSVRTMISNDEFLWSQWEPWSKCNLIEEKTTRIRRSEAINSTASKTALKEDTEQTRPCRCSDLAELPHPRILLLGPTGVGKSTLANQMIGGKQLFPVGHRMDSKTIAISFVAANIFSVGQCITIIDTPGAKDTEGRDYKHILEMQRKLKNEIKSFDVILLLFNGQNPRFDSSTIELLQSYQAIFGEDMWAHVITETTFWGHTIKESGKRARNQYKNETTQENELRQKLQEALNVTTSQKIPAVFIDPVVSIFVDPCHKPDDVPEKREKEKFVEYTQRFLSMMNGVPPYNCDQRCKAPPSFFNGGPWVYHPKDKQIAVRAGDSGFIEWQIWDGFSEAASLSYDVLLDDLPIVLKRNGTLFNQKGSIFKIKFSLEEIKVHNRYKSIKFSFQVMKNFSNEESSFLLDLKNKIDSESQVRLSIIKDAVLAPWTKWSSCSKSCIAEDQVYGTRIRSQYCFAEVNGGNTCSQILSDPEIPPRSDGNKTELMRCGGNGDVPKFCPVSLIWSSWTLWGDCSEQCGTGLSRRTRSCKDGLHGGEKCSQAHETESKTCVLKSECPRDCKLSDWGAWSSCSSTCNQITENGNFSASIRKRVKEIQDIGNSEGQDCSKYVSREQENCIVPQCPVDGVLSDWSDFSDCSLKCGEGTRTKTRHCIGPLNGGKLCSEPFVFKEQCQIIPCPVNCVWNEWQEWGNCSTECDTGERIRTRTIRTAAEHNGTECEGPKIESNVCIEKICPPLLRSKSIVALRKQSQSWLNCWDVTNYFCRMSSCPDGISNPFEVLSSNRHRMTCRGNIFWMWKVDEEDELEEGQIENCNNVSLRYSPNKWVYCRDGDCSKLGYASQPLQRFQIRVPGKECNTPIYDRDRVLLIENNEGGLTYNFQLFISPVEIPYDTDGAISTNGNLALVSFTICLLLWNYLTVWMN